MRLSQHPKRKQYRQDHDDLIIARALMTLATVCALLVLLVYAVA